MVGADGDTRCTSSTLRRLGGKPGTKGVTGPREAVANEDAGAWPDAVDIGQVTGTMFTRVRVGHQTVLPRWWPGRAGRASLPHVDAESDRHRASIEPLDRSTGVLWCSDCERQVSLLRS
jgi:hypothetical protein